MQPLAELQLSAESLFCTGSAQTGIVQEEIKPTRLIGVLTPEELAETFGTTQVLSTLKGNFETRNRLKECAVAV